MKDDVGSFDGLQSSEASTKETSAGDLESHPSSEEGSSISATQDVESSANVSSLGEYGKQVIQELNGHGILPTPYNYKIYFEKLLEAKSQEFKDDAFRYVEAEQRPEEKRAALESKVFKIQDYMVSSLNQVDTLLKNLKLLQNILKKHAKEVEIATNTIMLQNIIMVFQKELDKFSQITGDQLQDLKVTYEKTLSFLKGISDESVCNSVYGVYNKQFLEKRVLTELGLVSAGGYKSTLLFVRLSKSLQGRIASDKTSTIVNKSLSKLLQKVASRSDIIAYYGEGIFGILLSHSDKDAAKRFANRLIEKVAGVNIIMSDEEISLSVCAGIVEIGESSKEKEIIKNGLDALKKASGSNISFVVYGE